MKGKGEEQREGGIKEDKNRDNLHRENEIRKPETKVGKKSEREGRQKEK